MKSLRRGVSAALITAVCASLCALAQTEGRTPGANVGRLGTQPAAATTSSKASGGPPAAPQPLSWPNARVDSVATDRGSTVLEQCTDQPQTAGTAATCQAAAQVEVAENARQSLGSIHNGDHVKVVFQTEKPEVIASVTVRSTSISGGVRLLTMTLTYLFVFLTGLVLTMGKPLKLIVGEDQRYSNSKFQMALWFSILIATYIAEVVLRVRAAGWGFWGGVNIAPHLLVLSGVSAFTFSAAKGITTGKVQAAVAAGVADPKPKGKPNFLVDLVGNDQGDFDLGDFQMLLLTLLAVVMYLVTFYGFLGLIDRLPVVSLPDVDTTILSAFGLGQGAYLTKKAAGNLSTS